jgi:hypothetical protein
MERESGLPRDNPGGWERARLLVLHGPHLLVRAHAHAVLAAHGLERAQTWRRQRVVIRSEAPIQGSCAPGQGTRVWWGTLGEYHMVQWMASHPTCLGSSALTYPVSDGGREPASGTTYTRPVGGWAGHV